MAVVLVVALVLLALGVFSVAGSLREIADHNLKFLPPDPQAFNLHDGDSLVVRSGGLEQVLRVSSVVEHPNGSLTVAVEPVGVR